jgi:ribosomal protein S18 acetylase RimI-like enzyme
MTNVLTPATLPDVPKSLTISDIGLRLQDSDDMSFLANLFIQNRWDELVDSGWPDQQKTVFLEQQFNFQTLHYTRYYPDAARGIITQDAAPIGRLYLYALAAELRIVDISLLPTHHSQGIGTAMMSAVLEHAARRGELLTIHVEVFNRAQQLYRRLGFVDVGGDQVYRKMVCRPAMPLRRSTLQLNTAS